MMMIPGWKIAAIAKQRVLASVRQAAGSGQPIDELVGCAVYHERQRLLRTPHLSHAKADWRFIRQLHRALAHGTGSQGDLLESIVNRYAAEIEGHFDPKVYAFTTGALPFLLTALLNGTTPAQAIPRLPELARLGDRVLLSGETDLLIRLARLGTVILAPTHVSNLDSLLFGYALHRLGLPPFAYGAGLNLFESKLLGFFMRNLGAYTVDRAKSDPLYLAVLKEYATVALELGQHQLFFPGGTRSRSFGLESHLKKGLLGTALAAYRNNLLAKSPRPRIFVFPATCSYPLVLEAQSLVEDFLDNASQGRYLHPPPDESDRVGRWLAFLRHLLALDLDLHVRIGRPLDPFGGAVDEEGQTRDAQGRVVDASQILSDGGVLTADGERDAGLTRRLAEAILGAYRRDNVILPTWVLAYAALESLRRREGQPELYPLLRRLAPGTPIARQTVLSTLAQLLGEITQLAAKGELVASPELDAPAAAVMERGLRYFAIYHDVPVLSCKGETVIVGDASLLFYYRNRMDGYGLLGAPSLLRQATLRSDA